MYYIDDYIMRQIHMMAQGFAKVFLHKDTSAIDLFDEEDSLSASGMLYHRLKRMAGEGRINEAEETLFDALSIQPLPSFFQTAMQFYEDLTALTDAQLAAANFSRQEIARGLRDVARIFEIEWPENESPPDSP